MSKEIYISSTPHETRLAIVENDELAEIYYERENEYTLAGSIYNGRVTRVLPGMQSSFVEIGLERDAFLYITDFMEEAGDSADFEATHGCSGEARGPRPESQQGDRADRNDRDRSDRDRNSRGDRPERPVPVTLEASIAQPTDSAPEGRGEQNGRGDRNGRNRNRRGRGSRNGNPERVPATAAESVPAQADLPREMENSASEPASFVPADAEKAGEGAPGADGSRRWRGRRGRRRGRGPSQAGDTQPVAETATPEASSAVEDQFEIDMPFEAEETAAYVSEVPVVPPSSELEHPRSAAPRDEQQRPGDRQKSHGRDDGRNGRKDRSGRPGRGDRGGFNERPARIPRGFAPSADLYGVDAEASAPAADQAEPIILPGESLSKYRRGSDSQSGAADASAPGASSAKTSEMSLARPTTVVDDWSLASAWDGGAVLPGETLSRRSQPASGREPRHEVRHESRHQPAHSAASQVETSHAIPNAEEFSMTAAAEDQPAAQSAQVSGSDPAHETEALPLVIEAVAEAPETATPEVEYEPTEASVSYRIDTAAPSEFRQSAPVLEEELVEESVEQPAPAGAGHDHVHTPDHHEPLAEAGIHVDHSHPSNRLDEPDTEPDVEQDIEPATVAPTPQTHTEPASHSFFADGHSFSADDLERDTTGVPPPPPPSFEHEEPMPLADSDITSVSDSGEMVSHTSIAGDPEPVPEARLDPTSPIHHESAVVSDDLPQYAPQSFAPGSGQLEEELMDEEEHEPATLHAHYDEEFDDFEEETLEGAADLGTMIREMSIDQITRPGDGAETEEDDEFEDEEVESSADYDEGSLEGDKPAPQAADAEYFANTFREPNADPEAAAPRYDRDRRPKREASRDNRREGRSGGRDRSRSRSTGGESERGRPGHGGRSRQSMQATDLPAISDLLKPGQEILVQIAKEPIAKKGARITSHIALPGRFLVFMPTVNHTGVSRKIESDGERRRLKEILISEKGDAAGGFIVRTAASGASEDELRSDLRFLLNLWADIKQRSESSKSPALIYHDLNLVERVLRDQVTDNFSAIWVDTESEYERVLRFLQRFQPQLIRRVKLYSKDTPLFEQFGITEEINKALRSKVWLKSGGSIVINQTEALVAIDINTGKFVGKTARLEDTIVKTNLDAIPEIVRQIRLRDLGGIIIIDFIDMDERKNRNKVMAALEEELKSDRAPSKVLQFNDFGLVAITRKRVKQSLERTLSTTCGVCQGTGMTKSPITVCNDIYIEMRKMHKHLERGDVMLRVHPEVVKQLKSGTSKWLQEMEEMVGKTILVKSDPSLHPEQFDIH